MFWGCSYLWGCSGGGDGRVLEVMVGWRDSGGDGCCKGGSCD